MPTPATTTDTDAPAAAAAVTEHTGNSIEQMAAADSSEKDKTPVAENAASSSLQDPNTGGQGLSDIHSLKPTDLLGTEVT